MIYVPRTVIDRITYLHDKKDLTNPVVCMKIPYKGVEISISSDSSHTTGDLRRTDIRLYKIQPDGQGKDITDEMFPDDMILVGDAETLMGVFRRIDKLGDKT